MDYESEMSFTIKRLGEDEYQLCYDDWTYTCDMEELLDELREHMELMETRNTCGKIN